MHVETLNWSGMTVRQYAAAAKLSKHSLRRWRDLIDSGEVAIDWRARLHPSARPKISSGVSSAAKGLSVETELTEPPAAGPERMLMGLVLVSKTERVRAHQSISARKTANNTPPLTCPRSLTLLK